jgi:hypothetical protein
LSASQEAIEVDVTTVDYNAALGQFEIKTAGWDHGDSPTADAIMEQVGI